MSFRDIDDVLWESIEPYLPLQKQHTGRSRADVRKLTNGILYVVMTDCTWKYVPCRYGSKDPLRNNIGIFLDCTQPFSQASPLI